MLQGKGFGIMLHIIDGINGINSPKIGAFRRPGTGVILSLFGSLTMAKRLFALGQSPNLRNYQESKEF